MKKMIALMGLVLATSISSQACEQFEAQFIGKVISMEEANESSCKVQIDFSSFNSSIVCPLDISETYGKEIKTTACDKKAGDTISGILVDDGEKLFVE